MEEYGADEGVRCNVYAIRTIAYAVSSVAMLAAGLGAWAGVLLGIWEPRPADNIAAGITFFAMWMSLFAFVDNRGEKRDWKQRCEEFVMVWLISSGLAQVGWELPFVLLKASFLEDLDPYRLDNVWLWPFWLYGSGDTRYNSHHPESHATETFLACSGFFELFAAWALYKGRHYKTAMIIAALTHWGFFWANSSVIYLAEIYDGFVDVADGWEAFWIKWFGLNLQWSVLSPLCTGCALWLYGKRCAEEALASARDNPELEERMEEMKEMVDEDLEL